MVMYALIAAFLDIFAPGCGLGGSLADPTPPWAPSYATTATRASALSSGAAVMAVVDVRRVGRLADSDAPRARLLMKARSHA